MFKLQLNKILLNKEKVLFLLFTLLCFFPLMPFHIQSKTIIFWALITIVLNYKRISLEQLRDNKKIYLANSLWLFWMLITFVYTSDLILGLKEFQKSISLLIIPFILFFFTGNLSTKKRDFIFWIFIIVNVLFTIFIYWYLHDRFFDLYKSIYLKVKSFDLIHYIKYLIKMSTVYLYGNGGDAKFPLFFHKSYYLLNLVLCSYFLLYKLSVQKIYKTKIFIIAIILFFSFFILNVFSSKIHIVLYVASMPLLALILFFKQKLNIKLILKCAIVGLLIIGSCSFFVSSNFKEKIKISIGSRNIIYNCSIDLLLEKPFFGYGLGGVEEELVKCYSEKLKTDSSYKYLFLYKQNTHNYYMHLYLTGGIIGLLLFIYMLYYNLNIAINNNNVLYLFFLILIIFTLLVENSLSRINGVLFFTIFNSVFLKQHLKKYKNDTF